jgi:hypothetical protein
MRCFTVLICVTLEVICGNKMPTRCNRCRSYCLLITFRAPLCTSSGARKYYTGGCCLWYLVLWFSSCRYGVELRVMFPVCEQPANQVTYIHLLYGFITQVLVYIFAVLMITVIKLRIETRIGF